MFRKLALKFYEMTHKHEKKPFLMTDVDYKVLLQLSDEYGRSRTAYHVVELQSLIENKRYTPSKWELDQIDQFINDYNARFKSPLTKALE